MISFISFLLFGTSFSFSREVFSVFFSFKLLGLREDGILRVSGSAAQIKDLQNAYRKGKRLDLSNVYIHTGAEDRLFFPKFSLTIFLSLFLRFKTFLFILVGGVLKNYFRDMPKPVLTFEAYDDFLACAGTLWFCCYFPQYSSFSSSFSIFLLHLPFLS